jgi:hypothetical protein
MPEDITPEQAEALKIAGELIDAGVPVFAAAPNPDRPGQYYLPHAWQQTQPFNRHALEQWRPGWALGAVGGWIADFLDFDPRNGGNESEKELHLQNQTPRAYGVQVTPSGGKHLIISPSGERKSTGFMPGVDLQSGAAQPDEFGGHGRGFIYIAPTVRPSKAPETLGQLRPYVWQEPPDMEYLAEFSGSDDTLDGVLARVHAARSASAALPRESSPAPAGASQLFGASSWGEKRQFTRAEAEAFCLPHLEALQRAQIGEIEEHANRAAVALAHFVPELWSATEAYDVLTVALSHTAYDPSHPASGWGAEKFKPVLDGRRPPLDGWKAVRAVTPAEAAASFGAPVQQPASLPATPEQAQDMVQALLAEMLTPDQIEAKPAPRALIKTLLNLDSLTYIIGAPGSKKSFVVLDMAAHVVQGRPWQGLKVHQGPVVMIVAEGAGGMSNRIKAYQQKHGAIGERMHILPRPVQASDIAGWQVLVEACRRLEPVMVLIDTQARVTVGLEENSAKDMGVFVEAAERIRAATGACIGVVHHTGRNDRDARGSSAIDGAQGTELKVVRQDAMTGVLKTEKQKDLEERPEMPLYFERVVIGVDEDGEEITSLVLRESNEFIRAASEVPAMADPAGSVRVSEPQGWTFELVPGDAGADVIKRQLLQTIAELAGTDGLDLSAMRRSLTERWYAERSASGRTKRGVDEQTWNRTWMAVKALEWDTEPVVVSGSTARRFMINPLVTGQ